MIRQKFFEEAGKTCIITKGVSAHGSLPFKGENAISYMFDILNDLWTKEDEFRRFIDFYNNHIGFDVFGEKLSIGFEDEKSGKLVSNVGMIRKEKGRLVLTINVRYPVDTSYEEIENKVKEVLQDYNIEYRLVTNVPPLYFEADHFLIRTLLEVYREFTNDDTQPLVIGGGTYARWAKNVVAFWSKYAG